MTRPEKPASVVGAGPGGPPAVADAAPAPWQLHPAPMGLGEPGRRDLTRVAGALAAGPGDPLAIRDPDRAVVSATLLAALSGPRRFILGSTPDPEARQALAGAAGGEGFVLQAGWSSLDSNNLDSTNLGDDAPVPSRPSQEVAIQLFTGGTTGQPRIFGKTAGNLLGEAALWQERFELSGQDVVLATVSPLHIYGLIHSVLSPLLSGCRLVRPTPFLPAEVEGLARAQGATILVSAPAHLRALVARGAPLPGVRLVLSSGSMLPERVARGVERLLGAPVVEIYGSTESGAVATRCRAAGESGFTPLPAVDWSISGERLAVRSPYLSPGLPLQEGGRFLLADRVLAQGKGAFSLEGRVDDVVKIAGKRVDLSDLERRVLAVETVEDVSVCAISADHARQVDIGVLLVSDSPAPGLIGQIRDALRSIVRPRWIERVGRIPRTPTGKPDRRAMQARLLGAPAREEGDDG